LRDKFFFITNVWLKVEIKSFFQRSALYSTKITIKQLYMKESKNKIATLKKCKGYVIIEMFDTERKKKFSFRIILYNIFEITLHIYT